MGGMRLALFGDVFFAKWWRWHALVLLCCPLYHYIYISAFCGVVLCALSDWHACLCAFCLFGCLWLVAATALACFLNLCREPLCRGQKIILLHGGLIFNPRFCIFVNFLSALPFAHVPCFCVIPATTRALAFFLFFVSILCLFYLFAFLLFRSLFVAVVDGPHLKMGGFAMGGVTLIRVLEWYHKNTGANPSKNGIIKERRSR